MPRPVWGAIPYVRPRRARLRRGGARYARLPWALGWAGALPAWGSLSYAWKAIAFLLLVCVELALC